MKLKTIYKDNKCPRCEMISEMASNIWNAEDENEAFEVLKDIINMVEKSAYDDGYKNCCMNQIEALSEVVEDIENYEDENEDYEEE